MLFHYAVAASPQEVRLKLVWASRHVQEPFPTLASNVLFEPDELISLRAMQNFGNLDPVGLGIAGHAF
jgi:hypothetical protein